MSYMHASSPQYKSPGVNPNPPTIITNGSFFIPNNPPSSMGWSDSVLSENASKVNTMMSALMEKINNQEKIIEQQNKAAASVVDEAERFMDQKSKHDREIIDEMVKQSKYLLQEHKEVIELSIRLLSADSNASKDLLSKLSKPSQYQHSLFLDSDAIKDNSSDDTLGNLESMSDAGGKKKKWFSSFIMRKKGGDVNPSSGQGISEEKLHSANAEVKLSEYLDRSQVAGLKSTIVELQAQVEELKFQLERKNKSSGQSVRPAATNDMLNSEDAASLRAKLEKQQKLIDVYEAQLEEAAEVCVKEIETVKAEEAAKSAALSADYESLQAKYKKYSTRISELEVENEELKNRVAIAESESSEGTGSGAIIRVMDDLKGKIRALEHENKELVKRNSRCVSRDVVVKEVMDLKQQITDLQNQYADERRIWEARETAKEPEFKIVGKKVVKPRENPTGSFIAPKGPRPPEHPRSPVVEHK